MIIHKIYIIHFIKENKKILEIFCKIIPYNNIPNMYNNLSSTAIKHTSNLNLLTIFTYLHYNIIKHINIYYVQYWFEWMASVEF